MATYRQDVTKPLTPSTPDPTSAANAAKASRSIFGTLVEGAAQAWEMEKHITMKDAEFQTGEARNEFLTRNMAADKAKEFEVARDRVAANIAQGTMFEGPLSPAEEAANSKKQEVLGWLTEEAQRLRDAADGGMPNDVYMQRLQTITKKAIGKYPGLAQQIRQRLGVVSGLEYNDEWASRQFVADRFAKRDGGKADDTEQKLLLKDIDDMAGAGVGSREELLKQRNEDPVGFATKRQMWQESNRAKTFAQTAKDNIAAQTNVSNVDARKMIPTFIGVLEGQALALFTGAQVTGKQNTLASITQALTKNGNQWDASDVATMVKALGAEVKGYIDRSTVDAKKMANEFFAKNPMVDKDTRAEILSSIDKQAEQLNLLYGDKNNLINVASIFEQHKDKTIEQRLKLVQAAAAMQGALGNSEAVKLFYQGQASREKVKREFPQLYDVLEKIEKETLYGSSAFGMMNTGNTLAALNTAIVDAGNNSNPTPKLGDSKLDKPRLEAVDSAGNATLKKFVADGLIDDKAANLLTTMLNNGVKDGTNSRNYRQQYSFYKGAIEKLPEPVLEELRGKVGREANSAAMGARSALELLNSAKGTKLAFVYKDGTVTVDYVKPTANINTLSGSEDQRLQVEADKNEKAKQEYLRAYGPQLSNIVVLKALLTKESVGAVAGDLANQFDLGEFTPWDQPSTGGSLGSSRTDVAGAKLEAALKSGKKLPAGQTMAATPGEKDVAAVLKKEKASLEAMLQVATGENKTRIQEYLMMLEKEMKLQGVN